jgi:selenocysteine-specific elongation factor
LELLPDKTLVRVRRLQSQGADAEQVSAGERAAINVAGVKVSAIERGNELTTPNAFEPAHRHLVQLRILADAARGVKHRQEVRLHLAANQSTAEVLMGQRVAAPGEQAFAILKCETPTVAEYGQPFVLRQLSPARTIGGGMIIGPALRASDRQKRCLEAAPKLASPNAHERIEAFVTLRREVQLSDACESWVGLNLAQSEKISRELVDRGNLVRVAGAPDIYVTANRFQELKKLVERRCQAELERRKPATFVPLSVIVAALKRHASGAVIEAVLCDMQAKGEIVRRDDRIALPTGSALSNRQRLMLTTLVAEVAAAGPTPPTLKEFAERHGIAAKDLEAVVQVAIDEGQLIRLTPQLTMDSAALEGLRQRLVQHFAKSRTAKVGEIREQWGITRKHAVPIFEFFDQCQVTSRSGDNRSAGPRINVPIEELGP